ncbi:MAG: M48 family metallopeptidase [Candidatus Kaelpia aquatica]|nr:M48 family metallopeptidase [Candidatus Kaelpia aquatica]
MKRLGIAAVFLLVSGCVTTGPPVYRGEIYQAQEELKSKALKYRLEKERAVAAVGYEILKALPDNGKSFPYLGARFIKIDQYSKKLFNTANNYGIAAAYVVKRSAADKSGIRRGDVIKKINGRIMNTERDLKYVLNNLRPGDKLDFELIRSQNLIKSTAVLEKVGLEVSFGMLNEESVNAGASSKEVVVTYGLMRFIESEDELAIILGHELAHIARGHIGKRVGTNLFSILLGVAAGYGAESVAPGSGDVVMRGIGGAFSSLYSREFEREADYFGILYAYKAGYDVRAGIDVWERFAIEMPESMVRDFYNSHPTSTERLLRIEKIVRDLEEGRINVN